MTEIFGDITKIKKGIVAHQVNCRDVIGAGVSGAIVKKWPEVEKKYHEIFKSKKPVFGTVQFVKVGPDLFVANVFSQCDYGNSQKTGKVYTDLKVLEDCIDFVCTEFSDKMVYVPCRIGCGLAGGNWDELYEWLKKKDYKNLVILEKNTSTKRN